MSRHRLLIDASAGFNQGAGIGRYSRSLLRAALPALQSEFDVRLWYASDTRHGARFEPEALDAIPNHYRATSSDRAGAAGELTSSRDCRSMSPRS